MIDWMEIVRVVLGAARSWTTEEACDLVGEAGEDAGAFVDTLRNDLERWAERLAAGELTPEEVTALIRGKRDLARLAALRRAGVAEIELERLRDGLIAALVRTILYMVGEPT